MVPRSWTHLTAIAAHVPVAADTAVPQEWLDHVQRTLGRAAPTRMGDLPATELPIWVQPWGMGHNPDNAVDRADPRGPPGDLPAPRPGPLVRLTDAVAAPVGCPIAEVAVGVSAGQG